MDGSREVDGKRNLLVRTAQIVTFKKLKTFLKGASPRFKYAWPFVKFRQGGVPPVWPGGWGCCQVVDRNIILHQRINVRRHQEMIHSYVYILFYSIKKRFSSLQDLKLVSHRQIAF